VRSADAARAGSNPGTQREAPRLQAKTAPGDAGARHARSQRTLLAADPARPRMRLPFGAIKGRRSAHHLQSRSRSMPSRSPSITA
jgi:hypothetical protein